MVSAINLEEIVMNTTNSDLLLRMLNRLHFQYSKTVKFPGKFEVSLEQTCNLYRARTSNTAAKFGDWNTMNALITKGANVISTLT